VYMLMQFFLLFDIRGCISARTLAWPRKFPLDVESPRESLRLFSLSDPLWFEALVLYIYALFFVDSRWSTW
jgi:hypothetical protein